MCGNLQSLVRAPEGQASEDPPTTGESPGKQPGLLTPVHLQDLSMGMSKRCLLPSGSWEKANPDTEKYFVPLASSCDEIKLIKENFRLNTQGEKPTS